MNIKELRESKGLTQYEAAALLGISSRSFQNYEYGKIDEDSFKYKSIINILNEYKPFDIDKGIYTKEQIKKIVNDIVKKYKIDFVILFGSYAKGTAKEKSDIDLLIGGKVDGLKFIGLYDELCKALHKNIDLIKLNDLKDNVDFLYEIFANGVKIYGK